MLYYLSDRKDVQEELRQELRASPPIFSKAKDASIPSSSDIDRLPLLNAVLMETLRLSAAIPGPQPRISAKGVFLNGYGPLPAGVRVSSQAYSLHRNGKVFPDPESWNPHRWMPDQVSPDMMRWFWAFSSGGRMCIGSNFAMLGEFCGSTSWINRLELIHGIESKMALAAIYTNYETRIHDASGIEQKDAYTAAPTGEVWLTFHDPIKR